MSANHEKRELRVFLSSTFRDLQPEREELVKKTFPRIRKACRDRGVEFTEIDLRWGITEEESRSGRTIRICLEEIDRCRPYFIGILGSSYGWVPGSTEIEKDEELLAEFPWLAEFGKEQKSIIEMEFAHGAMLRNNDSAFFYEQQNQQNPLLTKAGEFAELDRLKETIIAAGLPLRPFATPEELGEKVYQDIVSILDRDFPANRELSPLEHERLEHEAYARNRLQSYVPNPEYYEIFEQRVNSTGAPLIVWGKSGLGKSALMAYFAHEYRLRHPEAFLVQHFIGAAEGSDAEDVMRQVMMEIKERYQLADAIPTDENALREEFPIWLAKVHEGDKLVLLIDALNQLTGIGLEMHWLPEFIPPNVRLVVSTTTDSLPLEELRKRNWKELELRPLTETQRAAISESFLERYSKSLEAEELHTLATSPKTASPLFLRTLLEELRIFGRHRALHDELEAYLACADERELFQRVLARLEHDHGAETVRSVMTAIWASRHGLSESELMEITGLPRMTLSILLTALEYHLMKREEFYTFFHNYLREAIELRYFNSPSFSTRGPGGGDPRNAAHARLAEYFGTREYGPRRRDEEPWQWREAGKTDALWRAFAKPDMFSLFEPEEERYHFIAYLQSFERERIFALFAALHKAMQADESFERRMNLASVARMGGFYDAASEILTAVSEAAIQTPLDENTSLGLKRELSQLYSEKHEYKLALPLCEEIVSLLQSKEGKSEELFNAMIDLSTVLHGVADYAGAERVIRRALSIREFAPFPKQLDAMQNLGMFVMAQGHYRDAVHRLQQTLRRSEKLLGRMHPSSVAYSMNLGAAMIYAERYAEALEILQRTQSAIEHLLGNKHEWYLATLESLGRIRLELGQYDDAKKLYTEMIESSTLVRGAENEKTLVAQIALGRIFYDSGDWQTALETYQTYVPRITAALGVEHPSVRQAQNTLNDISNAVNAKKPAEATPAR